MKFVSIFPTGAQFGADGEAENVGILVFSECGRDRGGDQKRNQARRRDHRRVQRCFHVFGQFALEKALWPSAMDGTNGFSNAVFLRQRAGPRRV